MDNRGYKYMYVAVTPDHQIDSHIQEDWELSAVFVGSGTRVIDGRESPFTCSEAVLVPPRMVHQWRFNPLDVNSEGHIVNITITFSRAFLQGLALAFPELGADRLLAQPQSKAFEGDIAEKIRDVMLAMRAADDVERASLMVTLISLASRGGEVVAMSHEDNPDHRRLASVEAWMACNYARKVTLDQVAAHVGLSRSTFCSWYKRVTGETFLAALNRYRLELAACHILATNGSESMCETAWAFGFPSVSHFNHLFHRQYGLSPTQYRMDKDLNIIE